MILIIPHFSKAHYKDNFVPTNVEIKLTIPIINILSLKKVIKNSYFNSFVSFYFIC